MRRDFQISLSISFKIFPHLDGDLPYLSTCLSRCAPLLPYISRDISPYIYIDYPRFFEAHLCVQTAIHVLIPTPNHNDIRIHFLRECVANGHVNLLHIAGKLNLADFFTKALPRVTFEMFRDLIGMERMPSQGGVLEA